MNSTTYESVWERRDRWAIERMQIDHIALSEYPKFVQAMEIVLANLSTFLDAYGVNRETINLSNIRFIDIDNWQVIIQNIDIPQDAGGFFDYDNNTIFIKANGEMFGSYLLMFWHLYAAAHELDHWATPELDRVSFNLSEGLADYIAREIISSDVLALVESSDETLPFTRPQQLALIDKIRQAIGETEFAKVVCNALHGAGYIQSRNRQIVEMMG